MDIKTWTRINHLVNGELLLVVPDGRDIAFRVRQESLVRFYALHEWETQWVKEARYELNGCPLMTMANYLDIRLQEMAELN